MNLNRPNANDALQTRNRSRDIAPQSGICSRCLDGCKGNCDIFKATFRGRELLYPEPFGRVTAGADKDYPVDYSHLNIMGYALGAKGIESDPDKATFPNVDTATEYGVKDKVKMKVPIFTGALGSTDIARKNWDHFAIGAAISGISLVGALLVAGIYLWDRYKRSKPRTPVDRQPPAAGALDCPMVDPDERARSRHRQGRTAHATNRCAS